MLFNDFDMVGRDITEHSGGAHSICLVSRDNETCLCQDDFRFSLYDGNVFQFLGHGKSEGS